MLRPSLTFLLLFGPFYLAAAFWDGLWGTVILSSFPLVLLMLAGVIGEQVLICYFRGKKTSQAKVKSLTEFCHLVQHLSFEYSIKRPHLYFFNSAEMNSLALKGFFGPGSILVNEKLLERLSIGEKKALISYSMESIKNNAAFCRMLSSFFKYVLLLLIRPFILLEKYLLNLIGKNERYIGPIYLATIGPATSLFSKLLAPKNQIFRVDNSLSKKLGPDYASCMSKISNMAIDPTINETLFNELFFVDSAANQNAFSTFGCTPSTKERARRISENFL